MDEDQGLTAEDELRFSRRYIGVGLMARRHRVDVDALRTWLRRYPDFPRPSVAVRNNPEGKRLVVGWPAPNPGARVAEDDAAVRAWLKQGLKERSVRKPGEAAVLDPVIHMGMTEVGRGLRPHLKVPNTLVRWWVSEDGYASSRHPFPVPDIVISTGHEEVPGWLPSRWPEINRWYREVLPGLARTSGSRKVKPSGPQQDDRARTARAGGSGEVER